MKREGYMEGKKRKKRKRDRGDRGKDIDYNGGRIELLFMRVTNEVNNKSSQKFGFKIIAVRLNLSLSCARLSE